MIQTLQLPKLAYAYGDLSPWIDPQTMEIHYTKHHGGYVQKLKIALEKEVEALPATLGALLKDINRYSDAIRNNAGGHYNHTLFWEQLTPKEKQSVAPTLMKGLQANFGDVDTFKRHFSKSAATLFGSGWTWLVLTPKKSLAVVNTPNQDNPLMYGDQYGTPLLGLDLWEHAYYLKYQNKRVDYIDAFWHVLNWSVIEERYLKALED